MVSKKVLSSSIVFSNDALSASDGSVADRLDREMVDELSIYVTVVDQNQTVGEGTDEGYITMGCLD